ncbi:MAG: aspartate aminotransferase family protein [Candidatus Marinimicrobia bacterium]|nr:aspartate aminotransferase family protein [Candidatus Neomarinimicrobiota bacterium]|tara:strand:+ start:4242 stop:5654 length:1413 start_codon:yes stop_codon:yes gene_type:complete
MNSKEFRKNGKNVIDWIADYYERIENFSVMSRAKVNDIRKNLPNNPPINGEPFESIMQDLEDKILPGITHWQSPNFYGFFPANSSSPAILGELLSSGFGINGMIWASSPSCTELETHMMDWLVNMLDLPKHFHSSFGGGGVIQDSASSATLCALLAAREKATNGASNIKGVKKDLVIYCSTQSHSSIEKAVKIAGIGAENLRHINVNHSFAMKVDDLEKNIKYDINQGKIPAFVFATSGTTSSTAFDPLIGIGELCIKYNIWLHVDAAMAGTAALCEEFRWINEGLENADSYCFNPHKWMLTNFDCDAFFIKNPKTLTDSLSIQPEYLKTNLNGSDTVIDYRDWQIPLGRRFRALKLWFVIRYYGIKGLKAHVRKGVKLSQIFQKLVQDDNRFELMAPSPLNLVCFRIKGSDEINELLLNHLNMAGDMFITHTRLNGKYTLRFCVGNPLTKRYHVESSWEKIVKAANKFI